MVSEYIHGCLLSLVLIFLCTCIFLKLTWMFKYIYCNLSFWPVCTGNDTVDSFCCCWYDAAGIQIHVHLSQECQIEKFVWKCLQWYSMQWGRFIYTSRLAPKLFIICCLSIKVVVFVTFCYSSPLLQGYWGDMKLSQSFTPDSR